MKWTETICDETRRRESGNKNQRMEFYFLPVGFCWFVICDVSDDLTWLKR